MSDFQFEVCANSVESCLGAREGGATRVELCANIGEGGTTPSYGEIRQAVELRGDMKVHVIIRPRGGDFTYSELELHRMADDIRIARELGADGVVFGCLNPDGAVDTAACSRLMEEAKGMAVTFHRAFDRATDPIPALEQIISLGFHRVLTSGQAPTAEQGIPLLRQLQEHAQGRIVIMAGCGVNEQNIARIYRETGIREFHFSAREAFKTEVSYMNSAVAMGKADFDEGTLMTTTARRVRNTIEALGL